MHINEKGMLIITLFPSCVNQVHVAANWSCSTLCGARDFVRRERERCQFRERYQVVEGRLELGNAKQK